MSKLANILPRGCLRRTAVRIQPTFVPLLVALASFGVAARAEVSSDAVRQLENQLAQLEGEMGRIEALAAEPVDLESEATFEERLSTGELYYILKMYDRASLVLYGAVSPPGQGNTPDAELARRPGYVDGVYQLAESLLALGNYSGARVYFEQLLTLPGHSYRSRAIGALIELSEKLKDYSRLDRYYEAYKAQVRGEIPDEIRYLHGKSLLLAGRDEEAIAELSAIRAGTGYFARAQYLLGAALVRQDKLEEALDVFTRVTEAPPVAREDKEVIELAHLARGRILYELDRLTEAIDAYQYIPWDSPLLPTMLYEVTWTYVRRGQLILGDESLTVEERRKKALAEYERALDQLQDLRALEPDTQRTADIELLAGNLRIQRGEFNEAEELFHQIRERWAPIDEQLAALMNDDDRRTRVLQDILAMEAGGLAADTRLPPLAARRAANNEDVRDAIRVFREIQTSRAEIAATEKMLAKLESLVESENRAERFPQLRAMLSRSLTLDNNLLALRARIVDVLQGAVTLTPAQEEELARIRKQREALQKKVESLPMTGEAMTARTDAFAEGYKRLEQQLHQGALEIQQMRAQLNAIDFLYAQARESSTTAPAALANMRRQIQNMRAIVEDLEAQHRKLEQKLEEARLATTMSGGQGASERDLRDALERLIEREQVILAGAASPSTQRLQALDKRAARLRARNQAFLKQLYATVDARVAEIRRIIDDKREKLRAYAAAVEQVNAEAAYIREAATTIALKHLRRDLHHIVVRADVGIIDAVFARKQRETEKIGRLQRVKTRELTELNQAYADLTRDEVD